MSALASLMSQQRNEMSRKALLLTFLKTSAPKMLTTQYFFYCFPNIFTRNQIAQTNIHENFT